MAEGNSDFVANFFKNLIRKKNISEDMMRRDLRRCFKLQDLTFLAISGMVGSGLYVLSGTVTREIAGPSIILGYIIAAFASILSALCYAEFAARIPVAGSAYQFTYLSVGEFWAFVVGWNVALEHTIYVAAIAKTCSAYLDGLFGGAIKSYLEIHAPMAGGFVATYPDFLSAGLIFVFALVLMCGVKLSSKVNIAIACINICVITFIIISGFILGDFDNWTKVEGGFFPYGWGGTISGSTTLVFSYVGYEVVASATEEAVNAARDIPLSLLISMTVVVISYVGASASLTLISPWYLISPSTPFPTAYALKGWYWAKYVVSIGALAAMMTCLISIMFVVPRYLLAMARDGLLWKFFYKIHPKTQVPWLATVIVASVSSFMAIIFSLVTLVEFIAIGQLLACTFVSICVIKLRYAPNMISSYKRADHCPIDEEQTAENSTDLTSQPIETKTEETSLCGPQQQQQQKQNDLTSNNYQTIKTPTPEGPLPFENDTLLQVSDFGTVKKHLLHSRLGFLISWALPYEAGIVPFYLLLTAILSSSIATILLLFATAHIAEGWFIILLLILILICVVCISMIGFFHQDNSIQTFKVPFVPFIPFLSIIINVALILKLRPLTWIRLAIWMIVGLVIYFGYGYKHSNLAEEEKEK